MPFVFGRCYQIGRMSYFLVKGWWRQRDKGRKPGFRD